MKSLEQIYILNYLSEEVWRTATGLLDIVERFDRFDKAEGEVEKDFYWTDAVGQLEMWRNLMGDHSKEWEKSLNEIDLEEINIELLDDCPDNSTLQNRLRIVKNRYFGTWEITKAGEKDVVFNKLLHIVDRLSEILFSVYDWSNEDAHRKAVKWHDYLLQKWCNVEQLQGYMQTVIDNAEGILNPQSDTSTEQEQTVRRSPILENTELIEIITESVKRGYAEKTDGGYYRWLRGNPLLAYFVQQLSEYLDLSEKLYEKEDGEIESTNWSYFGGIFETKRRGGTWELADGNKLHDYKRGAMKGKDRKKRYQPKGFEDIDDLMLDFR